MKKVLTICLAILLIQNFCTAQFKKKLDSLCVICNRLTTDSEKVVAMDRLANLYYTYRLYQQGDSVLHDELQLAELSDNNNLILLALFSDAINNLSNFATVETFDKTIAFLQKGIEFSKSRNLTNYTAIGYVRLSSVLRKRGQSDKAVNNATQALQLLPNVTSDSIKAIIYLELGNAYESKGEAISAVRNYNNAFDIAVKLKSIQLQCDIYHSFAEMYYVFFKNSDLAKDFLKKSLQLDKQNNYLDGEIRDYIDLSKFTDERSYLQKAFELSNTFHYDKYLLFAKEIMFDFIMVQDKDPDKALHYLQKEPELKETFTNIGIENYYREIGWVYFFGYKPDSALHYFLLAQNEYIKKFGENHNSSLFTYIANTYKMLNDLPNATAYYLKALNLNLKANSLQSIAGLSDSLSKIYAERGDYKQAFEYAAQYRKVSDSLTQISNKRDIALLDVERENRKHDEELMQEEEHLNNKRDAQYMLITIFISIIFVVMLLIGMFPVSKLTIKMLGYFFFISLFEFIVMVIDNSFLARLVHKEPLQLWLIKIVLIACLVPLQHFLEHNLIKFLQSRKLLEARTKFSFKKLWENIKRPAPAGEAGVEEDAAVL